MKFMSEDFTIDSIHRAREEMMQEHVHFEGSKRTTVRQIATEVFRDCGCHYNTISGVRLDNHTWQVDYDSEMPFGDKPVIEALIQEQLQLAFPEETYDVKLAGLGYHPR